MINNTARISLSPRPQGYYYTLSETCKKCPSGSICPDNGKSNQKDLELISGYWRVSPHSVMIEKCPHPHSCIGAKNFSVQNVYGGSYFKGNSYCGLGYTGPLCNLVVIASFFTIFVSTFCIIYIFY